MKSGYHMSITEIPAWVEQKFVSISAAERKCAQHLILQGISESNPFRTSLVDKQGNAWDIVLNLVDHLDIPD